MNWFKKLFSRSEPPPALTLEEAEAWFWKCYESKVNAMTGQVSNRVLDAAFEELTRAALRLAEQFVTAGATPSRKVYEYLMGLREVVKFDQYAPLLLVLSERLAGQGDVLGFMDVDRYRPTDTEELRVVRAEAFLKRYFTPDVFDAEGEDAREWWGLIGMLGDHYRARDLDRARELYALLPLKHRYALCFEPGDPAFEAFVNGSSDDGLVMLFQAQRQYGDLSCLAQRNPELVQALLDDCQRGIGSGRVPDAEHFFIACAYWHQRHEHLTPEQLTQACWAFLLTRTDGRHVHICSVGLNPPLRNSIPLLAHEFVDAEDGGIYRRSFTDADYEVVQQWIQSLPAEYLRAAQTRIEKAEADYAEFVRMR